jgi:hypothetical protein
MKSAMQSAHDRHADTTVAESMLHCDIEVGKWEGHFTRKTAVSLRTRPIHCKFETLRLAGEHGRTSSPYNRSSPSVAVEQLSARFAGHAGRIARPACAFAESRF